ncbi:hypothetical protein LXL04_015945 [Taraxacum kok-saghyz]
MVRSPEQQVKNITTYTPKPLNAVKLYPIQMQDYGVNMKNIPIYCDFEIVICICHNPVQHSKTKHIGLRYHFIKGLVEERNIEIHFVKITKQLDDIFTNVLVEISFMNILRGLGMMESHSDYCYKERSREKVNLYHFIKGHVEERNIEIHFVKITKQLDDIFTNVLVEISFMNILRGLGMMESHSDYCYKERSREKVNLYHFIKGHVEERNIEIHFVKITKQLDDIFTNVLVEISFMNILRGLGMMESHSDYCYKERSREKVNLQFKQIYVDNQFLNHMWSKVPEMSKVKKTYIKEHKESMPQVIVREIPADVKQRIKATVQKKPHAGKRKKWEVIEAEKIPTPIAEASEPKAKKRKQHEKPKVTLKKKKMTTTLHDEPSIDERTQT